MKNYLQLTFVLLFAIQYFSFAQGTSYCGPYTTSAPIILNGVSNQTITGLEITNPTGNCIQLSNCNNITIQNCKLGPSTGEGVNLYNCTNINITNCSMEFIETGVYAQQCQGGINITYNDVKNVQGPMPRGQMVQFNSCNGSGNHINYNVGENILGYSYPEDEINLYMSNGTITDTIEVIGNWIRGGGPSTSGGGIMCGDNGGSYILVRDNVLVNPGQYGIAIASGTHITILNNKVFSKKQTFSNVGLFVWNQYPSNCNTNTVSNNQINWTNNAGVSNGCWNSGNCGTVTGWNTNNFNATIDSTILPAKIIGKNCLTTSVMNIIPLSENIDIYPIPAFEKISVETSPVIKESMLTIYNISGQELIKQQIKNNKTEIDISNLTRGIYFVKLITGKTVEVRKIIKE